MTIDIGQRIVLDAEHPWPGLASFDENACSWFRGRELETAELFRLVESATVTVLYGVAGLGKTSLLQAGLFPRLRDANWLPVPVRLEIGAEAPPLVDQVIAAIEREAPANCPQRARGETLWEYFHRRDSVFWSARHRILRPVLVFDQFEELFTIGKDAPGRAEFLEQIADLGEGRPPASVIEALANNPEAAAAFDPARHRYAIIFSLREDYLAELDALRPTMRSLGTTRLRLTRMDGNRALDVVDAGKHLLDDATAEAIVRFVAKSDDDAKALADLEVEPALLSVVCSELNNKRIEKGQAVIDHALLDLNRDSILDDFYESAIAPFLPHVRKFVEEELLTPNGARASVYSDQADEAGVDRDTIRGLVDSRLVRVETRGRADRIELTHDLLTDVIAASRNRRREIEKRAAEVARVAAEKREAWIRRRLQLTNVFLALAVAALLVAGLFWVRYTIEKRRAARESARWSFSAARDQIDDERYGDALAYLAHAIRSEPENVDARRLALNLLLTQLWYVPERAWNFPEDVQSASISGDGKYALAATAKAVHVIDLATWSSHDLFHRGDVSTAQFTRDGKRVVSASQREVVMWDTASGKALRRWTEPADVERIVVSPDGKHIAVVAGDGVDVLNDGSADFHIDTPGSFEQDVRFSNDGTDVAVAWASGGIQFARYDAATGALRTIYTEPRSDDIELVITPSLNSLAVLDGRSVSLVGPRPVTITLRGVKTLDFMPDNSGVLGLDSGRATVWRYDAEARISPPVTFGDDVQSAEFNGDGSLVVTTSNRGYVRIWTPQGAAVSPLIAESEPITSVQISDGGEALLIAHGHTLELRRTPGVMSMVVPDAKAGTFAEDERTLFVERGPAIEILDATTGRHAAFTRESQVFAPQDAVTALHRAVGRWRAGSTAANVSADGRRVVATDSGGTSIVYDARTGASLALFQRPSTASFVVDPRLSADGRRVLFQMTDLLAVGSVDTGQIVQQARRYTSAEFDRSGTRVIATEDKNVHIFDAATLRQDGDAFEYAEELVHATFSADASKFVAVQKNGTAQVWQREPRQQLAQLRFGGGEAHVQLAPDGERLLVSTSELVSAVQLDVRSSIWNARTGMPDSRTFSGSPLWQTRFQGRGRRVIAADAGGVRVIELAEGTAEEAQLLADLAEHVAGTRFDEGTLVPVDPDELALPRKAGGEVARVAACFLSKDRTLTPFTNTKLRDYIAGRMKLAGANQDAVRRQFALVYPGR